MKNYNIREHQDHRVCTRPQRIGLARPLLKKHYRGTRGRITQMKYPLYEPIKTMLHFGCACSGVGLSFVTGLDCCDSTI